MRFFPDGYRPILDARETERAIKIVKDLFEKELHGLLIYRLDENGNRIYTKWFEGDQNKGAKQPTRFDYEKFVLKNIRRYWWDNGFDAKWYLSPIPEIEINKKYGLVQNPGW